MKCMVKLYLNRLNSVLLKDNEGPLKDVAEIWWSCKHGKKNCFLLYIYTFLLSSLSIEEMRADRSPSSEEP